MTQFTSYDAMGNVLTKIDARDKVWSYEYDDAARLKKMFDPLTNTTEFFYDAVGNKIREVDAEGNGKTVEYDGDDNLLAGRALNRSMHPFVPEELGKAFDLEEILRYGALPIVWDATDRQDTLAAYAQLYLKEEIQAEALVRNLPGFARFLPVAAPFHGQVDKGLQGLPRHL